ncbi:MAG: Tripartite ATP-independent periplasmic transporter, DctQ component [Clostridia bacterium]|jgi:TRAP-type C4-dicarboxylate transport system permease small subunit|nr:Tripartite ATP-independent periplasmic transporter, DctQ component [Clostridia bacterium]
MERLDKVIYKVLFYACAILMFAMAAIVTAQVLSRYIVGRPFTWSEELARYIFVWMSFLGMAVGVKMGSHVALDILVKKLSGVSQKTLMLVNNGLIFFFGACMTVSGFKLVEVGMRQKSPTLQLPMQYVYVVIPISGIILLYFVLSETIRIFRNQESKEKEELA